MKPIKLKLTNFGPFLNETIDFQEINNERLFLISGKTGSGKTMLFDAIVFALFGKASTEGRNESELRSHFADGKSPMSVIYEFELKNKTFKIVRQGAFTKEGNFSQTPGKLDVYELEKETNQYELRESKISSGNAFIKSILGVNAEQFRQLFILPQGEFKKFLVSNSSDKQSILRTLFNSIRFEEIQNLLINEVKAEKKQIESRQNQIQLLWADIDDFENETLSQLKLIDSLQTQEILKIMPHFKEVGNQLLKDYEKLKNKNYEVLTNLNQRIEDNKQLQQNIIDLEKRKELKKQLDEKASYINQLNEELDRLNEIKTLSNLYEQERNKVLKIEEIKNKIATSKSNITQLKESLELHSGEMESLVQNEKSIEQRSEYINNTRQFYVNLTKYNNAYTEIKTTDNQIIDNNKKQKEVSHDVNALNEKVKTIEVNEDEIDQLTQSIYELEREIENQKQLQTNKDKYAELKIEYEDITKQFKVLKQEIDNSNTQLENIDRTNIDLNDKQTFVQEVQSALHIGDTCPICGNEIESLNEHIDFEKINQNQQLIRKLTNDINEKNIKLSHLETAQAFVTKQMNELEVNESELQDINQLEQSVQDKKKEKQLIQEQKNALKKYNSQLDHLKETKHQLLVDYEKLNSQRNQYEILINDFEKTTQFNDIKSFEKHYINNEKMVTDFQKQKENLNKKIQQNNQALAIEKNNLENHENGNQELKEELQKLKAQIDNEMTRIGVANYEEIEKLLKKLNIKNDIEKEIEDYNHEQHKHSIEIERLTRLTKDKELEDIQSLDEEKQKVEKYYNETLEISATLQYKIQQNDKKFENMKVHINYLNEELKEQQQIFELAEVLSGKNNQKLTLENYVLIYYLERIIQQANLRLKKMSGQRYQLQRRQTVSQGYSGLEIDVFDLHSNHSRHISSLSGGETFQASLALALGLSEVVQQESGGITLDSMFIDEGFGTLDQETLETALDTLMKLQTSGRMVGIISHVSELKQRIPLILEVKTNQYQSSTQFKWH
ncbi:SMC family ATPase [Staphylococcus sp. NRL 16/872]|uniref:exonuclease subunit SbcC n=1 Tax=Staphylococcus sp. NRL 16/872 TaxID=2930131 RepID=UPI001FB328B9|nr:exonuclease subunit SbcC [Staphylococcus sp. NRL 16/872]WEN68462.1 SMC family ATPase [Staphylococcus sp. NRL 16/872]